MGNGGEVAPESDDCEAALRAGLLGLPWPPPPGLAEEPAIFAAGPNERLVLETRRLAGLVDATGAYETGRVLRLIARLLDRAGASEAVGRQFRDNLAAAILAHRARGRQPAWSASDTIDMFMELYGRVLGRSGPDFALVRRRLLGHAHARPDRRAAAERGGHAGRGWRSPFSRSPIRRS